MRRNAYAPMLLVLLSGVASANLIWASRPTELTHDSGALIVGLGRPIDTAPKPQAQFESLRQVIAVVALEQRVEIRSLTVTHHSTLTQGDVIFAIDAEVSAQYADGKVWIADILRRARGVSVARLSFMTSGTEPALSIRVRFTAVTKP